MKDFYVQLTSMASQTEFPSNASNSFKNRLPHPLQFREPGWKVGMSAISFPAAPRKIKLGEPFLFRFGWMVLADPDNTVYVRERELVREDAMDVMPRTGTEFVNWVRDRYVWALGDQAVTDLQLFKKKTNHNDPTEWLYMIMHPVANGECVIDNTSTCTTIKINNEARYPNLTVGLELAKKMQWIIMGRLDNGRPGYALGPHLRKEFPTGAVPTAVDVQQPHGNGEQRFYKIDNDGLHLSCYINWVFMNLDESYERAFGSTRRPLHVYSSAGQSTVMGNQVTDLLQEVPYALSERYFEPRHVQYLPLRTDVIDIIETQVAENNGELTNFESGVTSVTLHFKYE